MAEISSASVTLGSISPNGRVVRGTALPGAVVTLFDTNSAAIGTTVAGPNGHWTMLFPASVAGSTGKVASASPGGDSYVPPAVGGGYTSPETAPPGFTFLLGSDGQQLVGADAQSLYGVAA